MKTFGFLFLFIQYLSFGQINKLPHPGDQKSDIDIKGNRNIIRVIQGNNVTVYDLSNNSQSEKFLKYLQTIPSIDIGIKKIIKDNKKIIDIVTKNGDEIFNIIKFNESIEKYIRENERMKIEIENLKKEPNDIDFAKVLENANNKLENYDNEGYQLILEQYKTSIKSKAHTQLAKADYLQAENSSNNFRYQEALQQIKEAVTYDTVNTSYLILFAKILNDLYQVEESINVYMKVISIVQDDSVKSSCLNNIGVDLMGNGEYFKALEYLIKSVEISERFYGDANPNTALAYNNLGEAYKAIGKYEEALKYNYKALAIQEKIFGTDAINTATSYFNIASVFYEKRNYDTALIYYFKDCTIEEKVFGKTHPSTAISYNNIGTAYMEKKAYDSALEYYNKSLKIQTQVFGQDDPSTAAAYNNIGGVYQKEGIVDKALEYYNRALNLCISVLGLQHPSTAACYINIGSIYRGKGEYDSAINYFQKALTIFENKFGKEHSNTANVYSSLSGVYYDTGNYDEAEKYEEKALIINEKIYGVGNPLIKDSYMDIAIISTLKGVYLKALTYLKKVKYSSNEIIENLTGEATVFFKKNEFTQSINLENVCLEFLKTSDVPQNSILWVTTYVNLATAYCKSGKKTMAIQFFEKALAVVVNGENGNIAAIQRIYEKCKLD